MANISSPANSHAKADSTFFLLRQKNSSLRSQLRSILKLLVNLTNNSGRDDALLMRARYVELLRALQRTADYNPETVDALERILHENAAEAVDQRRWPSAVPALPDVRQLKNHAA
jgi:hypothetical protein